MGVLLQFNPMQAVKIYLSDEGFGPISRQKAIYDELGNIFLAISQKGSD